MAAPSLLLGLADKILNGHTLVAVQELTPTIIIYAPDKSGGKRTQEIRIIFNSWDEVELPEVNGSITVTPPSAAIVPYLQ